jgi:hypothetical protein
MNLLLKSLALTPACLLLAAADPADQLKINQIQVVGTHNSYHQPVDPRVLDWGAPKVTDAIEAILKILPPAMRKTLEEENFANRGVPDIRQTLEYYEPALTAQLSSGIRSVELDLHNDPKGGLYSDPGAYRMLRAQGVTDMLPMLQTDMDKPGLKVLHMADIDFRTSCSTFRLCLAEMRLWSEKHPDHSPIFVLIEPKIGGLTIPGTVAVPAFDAAAYEEFDRTIVETLGRDRVIEPDDVRGTHATLEEAVLADNWPTVAQARGKFLFLMLSPGAQVAALNPYLAGHEGLKGRVAFIDSEPGMPHAAFIQDDNAMKDLGRVERLVRQGYLVRARADIDVVEARTNDVSRRDKTLATGAQIVSTDFYGTPNPFGNDYHLAPVAKGFICNRVSAKSC